MKKVMFIGYGAMAKAVVPLLPDDVQLAWLLVTPENVEEVQAEVGSDIQVVADVQDVQGKPDLVIEMAGQAGLKMHAEKVLSQSWSLGVISVGALADLDFEQTLKSAAQTSGSKVYLLSGAVAGIDGLASAKTMGLNSVVYQGRKKPDSWKGSHAEKLVNLDELTSATVFFKGSARDAATYFPANANVAATIALAGVGMDETQVELIADPAVERNQHRIRAEGGFGEMQVEMIGIPLASNPKTSTLAALSIVRLCTQLSSAIVI